MLIQIGNRKSHVDIEIMKFKEDDFFELHSDVQSFDKFDLDDIVLLICRELTWTESQSLFCSYFIERPRKV